MGRTQNQARTEPTQGARTSGAPEASPQVAADLLRIFAPGGARDLAQQQINTFFAGQSNPASLGIAPETVLYLRSEHYTLPPTMVEWAETMSGQQAKSGG